MIGPVEKAMRRFRRRRMQQFAWRLGVTDSTRILDVGGTPMNWRLIDARPRVTLANMPGACEPHEAPEFDWLFADGCRLPFRDGAFDIVFSNSVIEHVGTPDQQRAFANEVRRVGQCYWVQTPNWWYPVEPHLWTPFLHYLPRAWQPPIVRRGAVWGVIERPSEERRRFYVEHYLRDIRLLAAPRMRQLFPDGELLRERHIGLTKSLVMFKARVS
jgi:Methyltransferase domain